MKTYVLTGESHICFDDEEKTILTITNSSNIDNAAIAYTKDPIAFNGLFQSVTSVINAPQNLNGAPLFLPNTEENFNTVKEIVLNKLNSLT